MQEDEKLKEALIMLSPLGPLYTISKLIREGKLPPLPVPLPVARSQLEQALAILEQYKAECPLCEEEIAEVKQKLMFITAAERAAKRARTPEELEKLLREEYRRISGY
jgi:hypothetical protein